MSQLDNRQFELRMALAGLTVFTPSDEVLTSCEDQMVNAVIAAVGIHGAAAAAVYAELVDLAVVMEIQSAGVSISREVCALVSEFQREAVAIVIMAELGTAIAD